MTTDLTIVGIGEMIAYTPQIVATELGYFQDEGLSVRYLGISDPEGIAVAVATGRADFALGGLWRPMLYTAELGMRYLAFAQMNAQPFSQVFARVPSERVDWGSLRKGVFLMTSCRAPSPWFAIQEWLRTHDVDPSGLHLIPGLPTAEAHSLFSGGIADLMEVADLGAAAVLADADLHPIVMWKREIGSTPTSVYYAPADGLRRKYAEARALARALGRSLEWVRRQSLGEIVEVAVPHISRVLGSPGRRAIERVVRMYVEQGMWEGGPSVGRSDFERWGAIQVRAGWLSRIPSYEALIEEDIASS